jgi:hypothetical protein
MNSLLYLNNARIISSFVIYLYTTDDDLQIDIFSVIITINCYVHGSILFLNFNERIYGCVDNTVAVIIIHNR